MIFAICWECANKVSLPNLYTIIAQPMRQLESPPDFCLILPWGHNITLVEKVKNLVKREWYARKTIENGWNRNVLELWIDSDLYHRQGKATNNFQKALPSVQSDLAEQILKDPYSFDFMTIADQAREFDSGASACFGLSLASSAVFKALP